MGFSPEGLWVMGYWGIMGYGLHFPANQLGGLKKVWVIWGYGLWGLWPKRESTVLETCSMRDINRFWMRNEIFRLPILQSTWTNQSSAAVYLWNSIMFVILRVVCERFLAIPRAGARGYFPSHPPTSSLRCRAPEEWKTPEDLAPLLIKALVREILFLWRPFVARTQQIYFYTVTKFC